MTDIKFVDNHIEIDKLPKKFKKLTGTRFATVMGLNAWASPFEVWCAITRTYEKPFEDTVYTVAGKVIEPKIHEYLKDTYFLDIQSPEDVYGQDYFKKTWGDFYPNEKIFGGMWDSLGDNFIVEIKTTKRAEDWRDSIPIYYKLQASLYAYLLGFDDVTMTVSFLEPSHYDDPESFEPSFENTKVYEFKLSEDFEDFEADYIKPATEFWENHVLTGISPDFNEKKDADILKELRKNTIVPDDKDFKKLVTEADRLQSSIDNAESKLKEKKDRLKDVKDLMKKHMSEKFREGDKKVEIPSKKFTWTLSKSIRNSLDQTAFKKDKPDLFDSYMKQTETYTLKPTAVEQN